MAMMQGYTELCVHHIKELKDHPEAALDDDNLVSL